MPLQTTYKSISVAHVGRVDHVLCAECIPRVPVHRRVGRELAGRLHGGRTTGGEEGKEDDEGHVPPAGALIL